jgi:hypothetical protein
MGKGQIFTIFSMTTAERKTYQLIISDPCHSSLDDTCKLGSRDVDVRVMGQDDFLFSPGPIHRSTFNMNFQLGGLQ